MIQAKKKPNDLKNDIDLHVCIIPRDELFFLAVCGKIKAQSWVAGPDECDIERGIVLHYRSLQNVNFTPKSGAQCNSCVLN